MNIFIGLSTITKVTLQVSLTSRAGKVKTVAMRGRKEGNALFNDALNTFYLRLYGVRTIQIASEETRCRHMCYSFRLAARVLLYAPSHRQDNTYHGLCYTSRCSGDARLRQTSFMNSFIGFRTITKVTLQVSFTYICIGRSKLSL